MRRYLFLAVVLASPACLLGVPGLIEETEPVGCQPGDTMVCYEGPEGTVDEGICRAGAGVCNEEGSVDVCARTGVAERRGLSLGRRPSTRTATAWSTTTARSGARASGSSGVDRLVGLTTLDDSVIISGDYANEIRLRWR